MPTPNSSTVEVLTVEEAAAILRISRNAAYALTRQWRTTGGRVGLPCVELGRSARVPCAALRQLLEGAASPKDGEPDFDIAGGSGATR
ncbi:MAG: helix-turn-helix domain-containing protein [Acidimicrobiia bacterium]|nr:helix-turn-helix domain-containing protein [Acidimicrobiia bacterium]